MMTARYLNSRVLLVVFIFILMGILYGCPLPLDPPGLTPISPDATVQAASYPTLTPTRFLTGLPTTAAPSITLHYLTRYDLRDVHNDLREPSGLALVPGTNQLWTVSDDNRRLFAISTTGDYLEELSFPLDRKGLEGVALEPTLRYLFAVQEENNVILQIDLAAQEVFKQLRLKHMSGYDKVAPFFEGSDPNKGLEGIDWHTTRGTLFMLKEGEPGLLLELSADLATIHTVRHLTTQNGFVDDDVAEQALDFSGLFFDVVHDWFWIVSDRGQRLFLYDWEEDRVVQSLPLRYERNGKTHEIEKAEGVVYDAVAGRLYVVSDKEARLYVFAVAVSLP